MMNSHNMIETDKNIGRNEFIHKKMLIMPAIQETWFSPTLDPFAEQKISLSKGYLKYVQKSNLVTNSQYYFKTITYEVT